MHRGVHGVPYHAESTLSSAQVLRGVCDALAVAHPWASASSFSLRSQSLADCDSQGRQSRSGEENSVLDEPVCVPVRASPRPCRASVL